MFEVRVFWWLSEKSCISVKFTNVCSCRTLCNVSCMQFISDHYFFRSFYPAPDPPPIVSGTGYCFRSICFFVSLSARLRENGWTDLHEIFRGVDWPWDDLIHFWVNSEKPRDAIFFVSNIMSFEQTAGPISRKFLEKVWSDHWYDLITCLVNSEKLCDAAMCHTGWGLLCFCTTACFLILTVSVWCLGAYFMATVSDCRSSAVCSLLLAFAALKIVR